MSPMSNNTICLNSEIKSGIFYTEKSNEFTALAEQIRVYTSKKRTILDPRTIVFLNIMLSLITTVSSSISANIFIFLVSLGIVCLFKMYKKAVKYIFIFFLALALPFGIKALSGLPIQFLINSVSLIAMGVQKFLPFLMAAMVIFNKVDTKSLVSSLNKMKLPKGIMLGFTVAVRFLPTIKKEMTIITNSMKMRGIEIGTKNIFFHPIQSLEYALVPVLFRATSLADDMTAAALVKGAESPKTSAELFKIKFGIIDYVFALSSIFVVGAAIIFDFDSVFMRLF
ncbi:energy-coupling factor transporter transmembrane protein EcfT [Treponema denticola]|uniref:Energy-coupling factor transporter transmembrane protein EcfT n=1 Tax=Treponema denticola TaxID=158 RepID=A0A9Q9EY85_TREDN|nr:energy-coupling factor transporter transmembrane component T [Treponema denticola]UTC91514.1 energy-coupling factor transporter transmembrane protein EcfT [Treponema denticola]UTD01501.1 energy-coupling factor transporter transmembrane protein EcfT [Treponema denticola]UTD06354.1 energy-coupling factor transporter transmembrane protein EcfT [Treponema denticola]UTD11399.1 energy-coupling factor transporter transmembrane protein EcfT [Treponema sp. B152]